MEYFKIPESALDSGKSIPEPTRINIELLPTGMSERFYFENLMSRFDAGWNETAMFADVKGTKVPVSRLFFMKNDGKTTKINKRSREQFIPLIAEGLMPCAGEVDRIGLFLCGMQC